jgi:hypothetical protein
LNANALHQTRQVAHTLRRNVALIRAAHGATHRTTHGNASVACGFHHRGESLNTFGNRAVDVLLAEGFAGCTENHDFVRLGFERSFKALQIGGEHRIAHT